MLPTIRWRGRAASWARGQREVEPYRLWVHVGWKLSTRIGIGEDGRRKWRLKRVTRPSYITFCPALHQLKPCIYIPHITSHSTRREAFPIFSVDSAHHDHVRPESSSSARHGPKTPAMGRKIVCPLALIFLEVCIPCA
jgi:hypothetical protein